MAWKSQSGFPKSKWAADLSFICTCVWYGTFQPSQGVWSTKSFRSQFVVAASAASVPGLGGGSEWQAGVSCQQEVQLQEWTSSLLCHPLRKMRGWYLVHSICEFQLCFGPGLFDFLNLNCAKDPSVYITNSGTMKALEYENQGLLSHSSQSGGYYKAILAAMIHRPDSVEDVPKSMNSKGFDALCAFFQGQSAQNPKIMLPPISFNNIKMFVFFALSFTIFCYCLVLNSW